MTLLQLRREFGHMTVLPGGEPQKMWMMRLAGSSWELAEEADVVLKKNLNVVDLVFEHGEAVDAHAECEAADFFGVVVDEAVDGRIDHAGAEKLDPAGAFALGAGSSTGGIAAAAAKDAGNVEFNARLGEREITWPETCFYARTEKLFDEIFDGAGEIAEGDVGVNREAFNLMKDEGVRGIGIVAAIDLAGNDDAHGRLLLFHGANLHRGSVRAEKERRRSSFGEIEIEGVHVVADRMKFGNVERFEIVVGRFNFGTFDNGETDGEEDVFDFLEDLADQMVRADGAADAGEREVNAIAGEGGLVRT